jgi:hypothetical protein
MTRNTPSFLIRDIKPGDLEHLADNLRNADKAELAAASGSTNFLSRLTLSVDLSENVKVAEVEGLPVLVYGYAAFGPDAKAVWCIGTKKAERFRRPLVERSRKVIREWFQGNPAVVRMVNFTYAKNKLYHRWLESIGAEILPEQPMGPTGALFHPFIIRRDSHV